MTARRRVRRRALGCVAAIAVLAACSSDPDPSPSRAPATAPTERAGVPAEVRAGDTKDVGATTSAVSPSGRVRVQTLSSRASLVTGGDALVEVRWPGDDEDTRLELTVDGSAAPAELPREGREDGQARTLVTGLQDRSTLVASFGPDPGDRVTLDLVDHPVTGPLVSGPKMTPFVCLTQRTLLGPAADGDCTVPTQFRWYHVGGDDVLHELADPTSIPAGVRTTKVNGRDVPFIVRQETGVLARSLYWITVLDPTPLQPDTGTFWSPEDWNRRLVYRYGGGCDTSYSQGVSSTDAADVDLLGRGYAIATGSLNALLTLCNPLVSAEVTMVVKEHFIEHYGVPELTLADGGSGGAIQQLFIAQNYPGLLDGLTPTLPFPDLVTAIAGAMDCTLFEAFWKTPGGREFTDRQRMAVEGFAATTTCRAWTQVVGGVLDPTNGCDPFLAPLRYDRHRNPTGVRCTMQDANVNVFGRDPATGFARRPIDNTGVQYGLQALRDGVITPDQFLDLNERIGGFDIDGRIVAERSATDEETASRAYRSGYVSQGAGVGGLADTPMILRNLYTDRLGDIHDRFRLFSLRDRLLDGDGRPRRSLVIWSIGTTAPDLPSAVESSDRHLGNDALFVMDEWLTAIGRRDAGEPWRDRIREARPDAAVDRCTIGDRVVAGDDVYDEGVCRDAFPLHGDPRTAAGAPRRNDIVKCALTPAPGDVGVDLDDAQRARLERIFPTGVCDWSRPGVGQAPLEKVWQIY